MKKFSALLALLALLEPAFGQELAPTETAKGQFTIPMDAATLKLLDAEALKKVGPQGGAKKLRDALQSIIDAKPHFLKLPVVKKWLHVKWHRNCYFVYAEYYFEAFVTSTQDASSSRVQIDDLSVVGQAGRTSERKTCGRVSNCSITIKEVNLGCKKPVCVTGYAQDKGISWSNAHFEWGEFCPSS